MAKIHRTIEESQHLENGTTIIPIPNGMHIVIDTIDFDKVKNYTWYFSDSTGYGAVKAATRTVQYKRTKVLIHKLIMGFPEYDVEYVDGNCLNNRRSNLALTNRKCRKSVSLLSPLDPPINDTKYAKLSRSLELSIHRPDGTTLIPLFGGLHTIIDTVDFDLVKDYTWTASRSAVSNTHYAKTIVYNKDGTKEYLTLHSLLLGKAPEGHEIDHEDLNGLNNRRGNLRISTCQQNTRNIAPRKNCSSGITGVFWNKNAKRWSACIGVDRKRIHLGNFSSKEEAAEARWKAEREIDSEFFRGHKIND